MVKRRGSGVGVTCTVGVGAGVSVKGIGVCEGGIVAAGGRVGVGVADAGWQEVRRINPKRKSFFIPRIKTQLPGALFQAIEVNKMTHFLVTVHATQKTGHLVHHEACPQPYNADQQNKP